MAEVIGTSKWKEFTNSETGQWVKLLLLLGTAIIIPFLPAFIVQHFGLLTNNPFIQFSIKLATFIALGVFIGMGIAFILSVTWWVIEIIRANHTH